MGNYVVRELSQIMQKEKTTNHQLIVKVMLDHNKIYTSRVTLAQAIKSSGVVGFQHTKFSMPCLDYNDFSDAESTDHVKSVESHSNDDMDDQNMSDQHDE